MRVVDLIRAKREGGELSPEEIEWLIRAYTDEQVPDYQMSAFLMAVFFRGMTEKETGALTDAMVRSGHRLDLRDLPGPKVDKHSTGGVGDKTSLILAPLAAACGVVVPMISGRGLGHTGGTLDKLESIPGFRTNLSLAEFRGALAAVGCALIGQTREIAPADKRLYALRDVTGTVESMPLIAGSIMSKKIAEGIEALVLDVKYGSGAFMKTERDARRLAEALVGIGRQTGVRTRALITGMNAPLGRAVGNALEIWECAETLRGRGPSDLEMLSVVLTAHMLVLGGIAPDVAAAATRVRQCLASGEGLRRFARIIERQGGDARVLEEPDRLPRARYTAAIGAPRAGFVARVDAEGLGRAAMALGAGRDRVDASVDHAVGILVEAPVGERVDRGRPILTLHYNDEARLADAEALAAAAIEIADMPPAPRPLIVGTIE